MNLSLTFSEDATRRLKRLRNKAEADDYAEVIASALQIYEWYIERSEEGYEIGLVKDGDLNRVVRFWK